LKRTLERGILANCGARDVEFVLLDYDSPDGLDEWVQSALVRYIDADALLFAKLRDQPVFKMAHAKNISHRLARGRIVCNLDADNFAEPGFAAFLKRTLAIPNRYFRERGRGISGRIACTKADFEAAGGYDEEFQFGWGWEDEEFCRRLERRGFLCTRNLLQRWHCTCVPHGDYQRVRFNCVRNKSESNRIHGTLLAKSFALGRTTTNPERSWGAAEVTINFRACISLE
jgi:glycosyltransferase involved in cell wall biosynthesis